MIRGKLWFRCAAMHDPVTPVIVQPALIGWEAKKRKVELTIERAFNGEELVRRMKGWVTTEPSQVIETVHRFGRLMVLDDRELVVEAEKIEDFKNLQKALNEKFGQEVDVELIQKSNRNKISLPQRDFLSFLCPQYVFEVGERISCMGDLKGVYEFFLKIFLNGQFNILYLSCDLICFNPFITI